MKNIDRVIITGGELTLEKLASVSRRGARVELTDDPKVWERFENSCAYINQIIELGEPVYGVTTGFGGMANINIPLSEAKALQNNLIRATKVGAGRLLPKSDVRAAMLMRVNSHLKGVSGIRRDLVQRLVTFLNEDVTPHVRELGSIGASGDLVPLSYITGAVIGMDRSYTVDFKGETIDSITALRRLGMERLELLPKEGLAMINGTSMMTGIAANALWDGFRLLALSLGVHALFIQGLQGADQPFHPFIHQLKPHQGQIRAARQMMWLLEDSKLCRHGLDNKRDDRRNQPIQDRYSLRCLPQYLGPIIDGFQTIARQVEVEANSANDNPLFDSEQRVSYHSGNFLGQYIGISMDQFRYYLGLLVKHLDTQIALLVAPEFSNGLPPSLVGNPQRKINMGLKILQICGNSIVPLIAHLGNPHVNLFQTHAEQFNQNINSLGFSSANLAREAVRLSHQYMAIALIFGVQAVDLRTFVDQQHYDARKSLAPATIPLYEAVHVVTNCARVHNRPFIKNDDEQSLDEYVDLLAADIAQDGLVTQAVRSLSEELILAI